MGNKTKEFAFLVAMVDVWRKEKRKRIKRNEAKFETSMAFV